MFLNIEFEYIYVFLLFPFLFICSKYCPIQQIKLYFPYLKIKSKVTNNSKLIDNILKYSIMFFILLSLSSPITKTNIIEDKGDGYEIELILDVSGSMEIDNRFGIVKEIVLDFINTRKNDKLGITFFADFAYVAVPLTYDKNSLITLLKFINIGIAGKNGTSLNDALFLSTDVFKNSKSKNKIAILLTDGVDNYSKIPFDISLNSVIDNNIKVYTIGIGERESYNPKILKDIAQKTNGSFFEPSNKEQLKKVYEDIDKYEKTNIKRNKYINKTYYFQYPLSIALLLLFYFIFRIIFRGIKND